MQADGLVIDLFAGGGGASAGMAAAIGREPDIATLPKESVVDWYRRRERERRERKRGRRG